MVSTRGFQLLVECLSRQTVRDLRCKRLRPATLFESNVAVVAEPHKLVAKRLNGSSDGCYGLLLRAHASIRVGQPQGRLFAIPLTLQGRAMRLFGGEIPFLGMLRCGDSFSRLFEPL